MTVILAAEDAYQLVRESRNEGIFLKPAPTPDTKDVACGVRDLAAAGVGSWATADRPAHLLVPSEKAHTHSNRIRQHVWKGPLPEGYLLETGIQGVLVQAPPLAALTLARRWPPSWLSMFICEMCGEASTVGDGERFVQAEAVSSLEEFERLLPFVEGRYGAKAYRKAVGAAANNCSSPLEAEARAVLCLPASDGGFETGPAESNLRVVVSEPNGQHRIRYLDIAWEVMDTDGNRVLKGVEVDGSQHRTREGQTGDHVRSYELRSSGIEELRCNADILSNQVTMGKFGESVRHMLGLPPIKMTKKRVQARMGLCQSIGQSPWHNLRLQK